MSGEDPEAPVRRFARDVAHEINNILTAVLGLAERLEGDTTLQAPVREQVALIAEHGRRLRQFSQNLSAFARGEAERPSKGAGSAPPARSTPARAAAPQVSSARATPPCVLLVDDEEVVRKILSWQLQGMGYEVVTAESVASALRAFDAEPARFGVALLDFVLGERDGVQLAAELRARRPELAVIMLTGIDAPPATADGDPWLIKPVALNDLHIAVERALGRSA